MRLYFGIPPKLSHLFAQKHGYLSATAERYNESERGYISLAAESFELLYLSALTLDLPNPNFQVIFYKIITLITETIGKSRLPLQNEFSVTFLN